MTIPHAGAQLRAPRGTEMRLGTLSSDGAGGDAPDSNQQGTGLAELQSPESSEISDSTRLVKQAINESVLDIAAGLVDRHLLRAYDAVQLAGGLLLRQSAGSNSPTFVSADHRLIDAAESEGIPSLNPAVS